MARRYPPIPSRVDMPGGTVRVVWASDIMANGHACWGTWDDSTRTVTLDKTMRGVFRWKILYHELAHVVLDDAGISNALTPDMVEVLCDAIATARVRERFGSV